MLFGNHRFGQVGGGLGSDCLLGWCFLQVLHAWRMCASVLFLAQIGRWPVPMRLPDHLLIMSSLPPLRPRRRWLRSNFDWYEKSFRALLGSKLLVLALVMAAGQAIIGQFLGVRYRGVPGVLYHLRFPGASTGEPLTPFAFVSRTVDGDYYEEDYADQVTFQDVVVATDFQTLPGIPPDQTYPFRAPPSAQELAAWTAQCQAVVAGIVPGRLRPVGAPVPGGGNVQPPPGLAQFAVQAPLGGNQVNDVKLDLEIDKTAGVLQWVLAEAAGDFNYGTRLQYPAPLVRGKKIVHVFPRLGEVFLKCIDGSEWASFIELPAQWDQRTLPVLKNALGKPERSITSVATDSRQEPVAWSVAGNIRSASWCISFLQSEGLGFEGHHERLRQVAGVGNDAWAISEHFQLMMVLKLALQTDQLDGANLACIETLFRRVQTIEFGWAERVREREAKGPGGNRLSVEEQSVFGGLVRQASTLMICPELVDHVRSEVEKEAKLQKALRVAREERETEVKRNKGKKHQEEK